MGECFSDIKGGKEAVGGDGAAQRVNDAVDHFLQSKGFRGLYTSLELSLSTSNLRDLDVFSKKGGVLEELARTEVVMNTVDPVWITKFTINYVFEIVQQLVFRAYDVDSRYHNMLNLSEQGFIGEASCALLTLNLQNPSVPSGQRLGTITVHAEETFVSRVAVEIIFRCIDEIIFPKSDPFLRISKIVEDGSFVPICKTEVIDNNLNPVWKPVVLTAQQKFQGSIADLEKLSQQKLGAHFYRPSSVNRDHQKILKGQRFVDKFSEKMQHNFLDYISSGFELNFMVAIDFSASNGNPCFPDSFHYIDPFGCLNAYQQAIVRVGEVIQFYYSDKWFPAWALEEGQPMGQYPIVLGIEGIMSSYSMALHNLSLAGPTLFGPVINKAAEISAESRSAYQNTYFILLIITDGVVTDLQETVDAIVRASDLPLSILIVGVGGAVFKQMEVQFSSFMASHLSWIVIMENDYRARDIVQFVPMRELDGEISIAQSLLEEFPGQFLEYMRSKGIKPQCSPRDKIIGSN
ncbi:putative C2 domain, copine, protein BONZAI, C2 domain superfamily [Dioscorea sansibarensis]